MNNPKFNMFFTEEFHDSFVKYADRYSLIAYPFYCGLMHQMAAPQLSSVQELTLLQSRGNYEIL